MALEILDMFHDMFVHQSGLKRAQGTKNERLTLQRPTTGLETQIRSHRITLSSKCRLPSLCQRAVYTVQYHSTVTICFTICLSYVRYDFKIHFIDFKFVPGTT